MRLVFLAALSIFPLSVGAEKMSQDRVEGGMHWRWDSENGPVHMWRPSGMDVHRARLCVWVPAAGQGERTPFGAQLAKVFKHSRRQALFIVPEPQAGSRFSSLAELIDLVAERTGLPLEDRPVTVVGMPGSARTIAEWLKHGPLDEVVLVDTPGPNENDFQTWAGAGSHKLVLVGMVPEDKSLAAFSTRISAARVDNPKHLASAKSQRVLFVQSGRPRDALLKDTKLLPQLIAPK